MNPNGEPTLARCYYCHGTEAPLRQCYWPACAWAWHPACQTQVDLNGPEVSWTPVTCPSGHADLRGQHKRVRRQWSKWAWVCQVTGLWAGIKLAVRTGLSWTFTFIKIGILLSLAHAFAVNAIFEFAARGKWDQDAVARAVSIAGNLTVAGSAIGAWMCIIGAQVHFWRTLMRCWRVRTVDYT